MTSMRRGTDGSVSLISRELSRSTRLTREEEAELARRANRGDERALHRLIESNLRFVVCMALDHRGRGLSLDDLVSEGFLGLIEATRRFDPDRGVRFISYAMWWVRKSMRAALWNNSRLVRVPASRMRRESEKRRREILDPLPSGPAGAIRNEGVAPRQHREGYGVQGPVLAREVSLDDRRRDGGTPLIERLSAGWDTSPERRLIKQEERQVLEEALALLTDREREVLALRFGLTGSPRLSYKGIARRIGLSHERVRNIEIEVRHRLFVIMRCGLHRRTPSDRRMYPAAWLSAASRSSTAWRRFSRDLQTDLPAPHRAPRAEGRPVTGTTLEPPRAGRAALH